MTHCHLTWQDIRNRVKALPSGPCYGVPRGGAVVAGLTGRAVDSPDKAAFIVDDIIDSGRTRKEWVAKFPGKPFHALVDKTRNPDKRLGWIHFPWEEKPEVDAEHSVVRLLEFIGEDPNREGLLETPKRVIKAWGELTEGYRMNPAEILSKDFEGGSYDQMIVCRGIEFHSTCEHHMLPFTGIAHVAYIPRGRVVGLSKMARLVDCYSRRLQIQEQMTQQIASAMQKHLKPQGVGVLVIGKHACMSCRGVRKHRAEMVTTSLLGLFRSTDARMEFMSQCDMRI